MVCLNFFPSFETPPGSDLKSRRWATEFVLQTFAAEGWSLLEELSLLEPLTRFCK
jgi:hypothetical protein